MKTQEALSDVQLMEIRNYPSAPKLFNSLRHLGYDHMDCIKDIIDNSIDAKAKNINVSIEWETKHKKGCSKIVIADDGCGMNKNKLIDAMKLASAFEKNMQKDLGLYGMGLITASIGIGRKLSVYTKDDNNELWVAHQDIDKIDDFKLVIKKGNKKDNKFFENQMDDLLLKKDINGEEYIEDIFSNTGTVVVIDSIDTLSSKSENVFIQNLKATLGQTYRIFLNEKGINITVNSEIFPVIDPIRDYPSVYGKIEEETVILESGYLKLHIAELETSTKKESKQKNIGIDTRGFYVLRNGREIKAATTFNSQGLNSIKLFPSNHECNNLRIEMRFIATMDDEMGLHFAKNNMRISDDVKEKIKKKIEPYINRCVDRNRKRHNMSNKSNNKIMDRNIEITTKMIEQKSSFIKGRPQSYKEKRSYHKRDNDNKGVEPKNTGKVRVYKKKNKKYKKYGQLMWRHWTGGFYGPIFQPEWTYDTGDLAICLNIEHPLYQQLSKENGEISISLLSLFYCQALCEINESNSGNDANYELITLHRHNVGQNLATLLRD